MFRIPFESIDQHWPSLSEFGIESINVFNIYTRTASMVERRVHKRVFIGELLKIDILRDSQEVLLLGILNEIVLDALSYLSEVTRFSFRLYLAASILCTFP
jgi:hypothetical protein